MMASEILAKGVERGIITAEQAERLRALETADEAKLLVVGRYRQLRRHAGGFPRAPAFG